MSKNYNKLKSMGTGVSNVMADNAQDMGSVVSPEAKVSKFDFSNAVSTTFNSGYVVPIDTWECLPGDIFDIDVTAYIRGSIPYASTLESPKMEVLFFFVADDYVWKNFKQWNGESSKAGYNADFADTKEPLHGIKVEPGVNPDHNIKADDYWNYLGIPAAPSDLNSGEIWVPSRFLDGYIKIWNDFFRDENLQDAIYIKNLDEDIKLGVNPERLVQGSTWDLRKTNHAEAIQYGLGLLRACKRNDIFTTCLPWPQKGPNVGFKLFDLNEYLKNYQVKLSVNSDPSGNKVYPLFYEDNGSGSGIEIRGNKRFQINQGQFQTDPSSISSSGVKTFTRLSATGNLAHTNSVDETPLVLQLNQLRDQIVLQHFNEVNARGGTRYLEQVKAHFGVSLSSESMQRAKYVGGFSMDINTQNIIQTSSTSGSNYLGTVGGLSINVGRSPSHISYSCNMHGILHCLVIVRPQNNYPYGLKRKFSRSKLLDRYYPDFEGISEQPIWKNQIFYDYKTPDNNWKIFGFNEPFINYKYNLNTMSGHMNPTIPNNFAKLYRYYEIYDTAPSLNNAFINQTDKTIGDSMLLDSGKLEFVHQYLAHFQFYTKIIREMSVNSMPGVSRI